MCFVFLRLGVRVLAMARTSARISLGGASRIMVVLELRVGGGEVDLLLATEDDDIVKKPPTMEGG